MGMEFCQGGELFTLITSNYKIQNVEEKAKFYTAEVVLALEYMHDNGVMHRDLKTENILIGSDGHAKLTDFGVSKGNLPKNEQGAQETRAKGTSFYQAPEMLTGQPYGWTIDFWALGLVIYEMLSQG